MLTKSIIASLLVLGTSSVALAAPCETPSPVAAQPVYTQPVYTSPVHDRPVYQQAGYAQPGAAQPVAQDRDHDQDRDDQPWRAEHVLRPVTLASDVSFATGGRKLITVGANKGRFTTLTVQADGGRTNLKQVYVQFTDGHDQMIRNVDQTLTGNASLTLDLTGTEARGIKRIVVYGTQTAQRRSWNHTTPSAFTVTAV